MFVAGQILHQLEGSRRTNGEKIVVVPNERSSARVNRKWRSHAAVESRPGAILAGPAERDVTINEGIWTWQVETCTKYGCGDFYLIVVNIITPTSIRPNSHRALLASH